AGYFRTIYQPSQLLSIHSDLQVRHVGYSLEGMDNDLRPVRADANFLFFNPKFGVNYTWKKGQQLFLSWAVANKEPSRGDFIDNTFSTSPQSEHLQNWELGYRAQKGLTTIELSGYYMNYRNQLVLTGEVNDVGAPIRVNVPKSYRLGLESTLSHQFTSTLALSVNAALSGNKISSFEEVIADYSVDFERVIIDHKNTNISFSPTFIGAIQLLYKPMKGLDVELSSKFVSKQYLDNTENSDRSLPAYHYQNLRLQYTLDSKYWRELRIICMVNNLLNRQYASNGYTYSYIFNDLITENFLYPQAGRHWMIGINAGF
ncbi:MAG: TonB-dependent receptor, partial [Saprospiraceae bacterium]